MNTEAMILTGCINRQYSKTYQLRGLNVASSKNSKRIVRGRLINSKLAMDYYNFVMPILEQLKPEILSDIRYSAENCIDPAIRVNGKYNGPLKFHFYYYRKDHRHFDYCNVVQILADAFQKAGILEDDDMEHFIPVFDGYTVDKENPGVSFYIEFPWIDVEEFLLNGQKVEHPNRFSVPSSALNVQSK